MVQFQVGYKGLIDLAYRSGEVDIIQAQAVHENDVWECEFGIEPKLKHIPADTNRGEVVRYYAMFRTKYRLGEVEEIISEMEFEDRCDEIVEVDDDLQLLISGWYVFIPSLSLYLRAGVACVFDEEAGKFNLLINTKYSFFKSNPHTGANVGSLHGAAVSSASPAAAKEIAEYISENIAEICVVKVKAAKAATACSKCRKLSSFFSSRKDFKIAPGIFTFSPGQFSKLPV